MKKYISKICVLVAVCILFTSTTSYAAGETFSFIFNSKTTAACSNLYVKNSNKAYAEVTIKMTILKKGETVDFFICDQRGNRVTDVVTYTGESNKLILKYKTYTVLESIKLRKAYRLVAYYKGKNVRVVAGELIL